MTQGLVRSLALGAIFAGLGACGVDEGCPVGLVRNPATRVCVVPAELPPPPATAGGTAGTGGAGGAGGEGGAAGTGGAKEMPVTIQGVLLDGTGLPIVGVPVSLTAPGSNSTAATVLSTPDGSYSLTTVISGASANLYLKFDGTGAVGSANFPVVQRRVAVSGGQMTALPPIYLPALNTGLDLSGQPGLTVGPNTAGGLDVSAPGGLVVGFPNTGEPSVIGLAPPGGLPGDLGDDQQTVVTFPVGATISFPPGTDPSMSLTGVPTDRTPFDLAPMSAPSDIIALEPAGAEVGGGTVQVTLPNRHNLPPGSELDLFTVDPDSGSASRAEGAQAGEHDAKVVVVCNDPTDNPDPPAGMPCPSSGVRLQPAPLVAAAGPGRPIFDSPPMTRIRLKRTLRRLGTFALQCPTSEITGKAQLGDGTAIAFGTVRFQQVGEDGNLHLLPVSTTTGGDGSFSISLPACADSRLRIVVESILDSSNPKAAVAALAALPATETTLRVGDLRNVTVTGDQYYLVDVTVRLSGNDGAATTPLRASPCPGTRPDQCTAVARHPLASSHDAEYQYTRRDGTVLHAPNGTLAVATFTQLPVPVNAAVAPGPLAKRLAGGPVTIASDNAAVAAGGPRITAFTVDGNIVKVWLAQDQATTQFGARRLCFQPGYQTNASAPSTYSDGALTGVVNSWGDHSRFRVRFNNPAQLNTTYPFDKGYYPTEFGGTPTSTLSTDAVSFDELDFNSLDGLTQIELVSCVSLATGTSFGSVFFNLQNHINCDETPRLYLAPPSNTTQPTDNPLPDQPTTTTTTDEQPKLCSKTEGERVSPGVSIPVGRPPEGYFPRSAPKINNPMVPPPPMTPGTTITPGHRPPTTVDANFPRLRGKLLDRYIFRVEDTTNLFRVWRIDCVTATQACTEVLIGTGQAAGFVRDVVFYGTAPNALAILTANGNAYVHQLSGTTYPLQATLPLGAVSSAERIVSGDFNNDTLQDVAVAVKTGNTVGIYLGTAAPATFTASTQTTAQTILGIQAAPLVFTAGPTSNGMIVLVQVPASAAVGPRVTTISGAALAQNTTTLANLNGAPSLMDTRDYDGDGRTDLVVVANVSSGGRGQIATGNGAGGFNPGTQFGATRGSALRFGVSSLTRKLQPPFDDRDSDTDLAFGVAGGVEWYEQVPSGPLDAGFVLLGLRPHHIGIADYDGDGLLDVAGVNDRTLGDQPEGLTHWVAPISPEKVSLATTPTADPRPYLGGMAPRAAKPGWVVAIGGAQLKPLTRLVLVDSRGQPTVVTADTVTDNSIVFKVPSDAQPGKYVLAVVTDQGAAIAKFRVLPARN